MHHGGVGGGWSDLGEAGETVCGFFRDRTIAQPVDVAQIDAVGFQRFLRPNDDAARAGVEIDDI